MKMVKIIALIFLGFYILATCLIIWDGLKDEIETADVAIVFGNKVMESGEPSPRLQSRLDKAFELYSKNYFQQIIVSGGFGKEGFDEALVMAEYLKSNGIPESDIIVDQNGYDTYQTIINASQLMSDNEFSSALVISQYFHIARIKLTCKRIGLSPIYSAHAEYFGLRDVYSIIRESIAFVYYAARTY